MFVSVKSPAPLSRKSAACCISPQDTKSGIHLCYYLLLLQNPKVLEYIQGVTKVVEGQEGVSYEEQVRILGWSSLEESRLRPTSWLPYRFLSGGSEEGSAELFSLVFNDRTCVIGSELPWRGSDWTSGSIFLLRGWSSSGTGFPLIDLIDA